MKEVITRNDTSVIMERTTVKQIERKNDLTKLILKENTIVTVLDLSGQKLTTIDNIEFPPNLIELNLSNNKLENVPTPVLNLNNLKILNLSTNNIKYFNETPAFCHTIEKINLSNNDLQGPPYWVWTENPRNLIELDISWNRSIRKSLTNDYLNELLQYKPMLSIVKMHSCRLNSHYELLGTFANVKMLDLSSEAAITANYISSIPCQGLDQCCNIERLILRYTYLSIIHSNIDIYNNLIELNLSENRISSLPNEICNLKNLEICILSVNTIMYLPDDIVKLKKLTVLCLDSNKLCMLPENMNELLNLTKLDVYDNYLYEAPECCANIQELDLAQNYFDEPVDEAYHNKKRQLRIEVPERFDGRKFEIERPESPRSVRSVDEELADIDYSQSIGEDSDATSHPPSSPEDWDSDEFWVPHFPRTNAPSQSPWLFFVKRKMAEGNFCPMDMHTVSVTEQVQYEKLCNPQVIHESDGQFDDYSSDDS